MKGITVNLTILNPLNFDQFKVVPVLKNFFVGNIITPRAFHENIDVKQKKNLIFIHNTKGKEFLILKYKTFSTQEALNFNSGSLYSKNKKVVILSTW